MRINAVCHLCAHQHTIDFDPTRGPGAAFSDWIVKHGGHDIDFIYPRRSGKDIQNRSDRAWQHYLHNADVKVAYGASAAPTMTLASLAASSTLLGGRESTAVDNGASNKYLDYLVAGHFRAGAANNQAGSILVTVVGARSDTPAWPDVFDGTDSAETVSKQGIFDQVCKILAAITADNTASATWSFGPDSLASLFGGFVPDQFVYFVTHNIQTTTNVWSATEGDHTIIHTPVYATTI